MSNYPPTNRATDPVAADSANRRLLRATRQLADLLTEAKPLIEILNSQGTQPAYRAALRDLVGLDRYFSVVGDLQAMTSEPAWRAAHATQVVPSELAARLKALGVLDGDDVAHP